MDKEYVHIHNGILLSLKKNEIMPFASEFLNLLLALTSHQVPEHTFNQCPALLDHSWPRHQNEIRHFCPHQSVFQALTLNNELLAERRDIKMSKKHLNSTHPWCGRY